MPTTPEEVLQYWEEAHYVLSDRQRRKFLVSPEINDLVLLPGMVVRTAVQSHTELSVIVKRAWDGMTSAERKAVGATSKGLARNPGVVESPQGGRCSSCDALIPGGSVHDCQNG